MADNAQDMRTLTRFAVVMTSAMGCLLLWGQYLMRGMMTLTYSQTGLGPGLPQRIASHPGYAGTVLLLALLTGAKQLVLRNERQRFFADLVLLGTAIIMTALCPVLMLSLADFGMTSLS